MITNNSKKQSLITKLIFIVTIGFIIVFSSIYFIIYQHYKDSLYKEQVDKINLLLNTLEPSVKINLEFGIVENINKNFKEFIKLNKEVKSIKLINPKNDLIAYSHRENNYKDIIVNTKEIKDDITGKTLAFLKISYSNNSYIESINKFQILLISIGIAIVLFLVFFAKILQYILNPLSKISQKLQSLDPEHLENFDLQVKSNSREIEIINNTLVAMIQKINSHTKNLQNQVEQEIKKNQEKEQFMLQQSRLAQLGEMISMIAHQWRQPLASISSTTSSLELKILLDQYDEKYFEMQLKNISKYSQYLSSTINDFRNFFRANNTQETTSVNDIVKDALSIISYSLHDYDIELKEEYNSTITLETYKNEIQQVVLNILKNAQDILIEKKIEKPYIYIKTFDKDNSSYITIEDNGGGIESSIIEKVFDPYFTTKDKKDGTGLGLYMSKRIIENRCNGTLSVSNSENGAIFTIKIN